MGNGDARRIAVVIEDELDIRTLLGTVLTQAGFHVIPTSTGVEGIEAVREHKPLVTTLDVNMPGMDGFEVARRIREFSDTYVVMLTALHDEIDMLKGLESGADDYLTKPFRPRELRARIEAMLRRPRSIGVAGDAIDETPAAPQVEVIAERQSAPQDEAPVAAEHVMKISPRSTTGAASPPVPAEGPHTQPAAAEHDEAAGAPVGSGAPRGSGWLGHNGLWANIDSRQVMRDGSPVDLLRNEFDLLATLLQTGRRVRTKPDLVLFLRGESYVTSHFVTDGEKRAIDANFGSLRKKLAESPTVPRFLEVVDGIGYRLTVSDTT